MLTIIALVLIIAGVVLIISGLREKVESVESGELQYRVRKDEFLEFEEEAEEESKPKKEFKAGGIVLIGPIPIVFGETRLAIVALVLAIILMLLSIFLFFLPYQAFIGK